MPETTLRTNSLALYKTRPARITSIGKKKLDIKLEGGETLSVRHKDVTLLHPGPLESLADLDAPTGEIKTAWELLAGETTTLAELTELAHGEFTPAAAWATWQQVADGLYFSGEPDDITVHTAESVAAEQEARAAKAAEAEAWEAFLERVQDGRFAPEDNRYLQEVAAVAMGQQEKSRVLRELGRSETPENAHDLLLSLGYWEPSVNPYPTRIGVITTPPEASLPSLPEEERRDLTHLTAVAIDDKGSTDADDALSWEDGILWVHVADVAALVTPDSEADLEARARGANLYLPEGTLPMLPDPATETLALGMDEVSPALSFGIELDDKGDIVDLEIMPSWVKIRRTSYDEAENRLDEPPFRQLYAIAQRHAAKRRQNGAIVIDLPEVQVKVDEAGQVEIRPLPHLRSRDLVQEAMLIAGEAVARYAQTRRIPLPYTSQEPPDEIDQSEDTLSNMMARRRSMTASQQSLVPGPHAGLGMEIYVQATSPLRRYLDLVVHQQLRAYLRGQPLLDEQAMTTRIGAAAAVTGDVRWAERQSNRHWTMVYLLQNPEWQGEGIVVDRRGKRDVILIPALDLETRIYSKKEQALDTAVTVQLKSVNLAQLEAHFRYAK